MSNKQVGIEFKQVQKSYEDKVILPNLSFQINRGDFVTILGTSGSGKTTTLKLINRLIEPSKGQILLNGQDTKAQDLTKLRRQIGYVVQSIGLFPHMTVAQNIAIVPELLGWQPDKIAARVDELLTLVQLDPSDYKKRYPRQLSGGQAQRIGVVRALAANPDFVLFDEPFGAIDALTRLELQKQLKQIHQQMPDKTFVFVTHDIAEAFFLANKVMIMNEGRIEAYASPKELLTKEQAPFVKQLLETVTLEQEMWRDLHA
ncbi:osmoprotectant transport system ATP-binding protein [Ligilactobacillus sp. WC1T17]|uniref:Osmoprotectant transport system ATP-binding protein n=1 Tax=Ligilactobacillus ruminis TaxID=1623 RepID=A0ABY1ACR6_9LACO|nr:osmoprotectant transport system ATP-binding protein [Ligilactobacillus ruminis]